VAAVSGEIAFPLPFGTIQVTVPQQTFLEGLTAPQLGAYAPALPGYVAFLGASSGMAVNGAWPAGLGGAPGFFSSCQSPGTCFVPASYQTLSSQRGNFPVFEGTSLYSLRLDHNLNNSHRLTLRANVSPSTVTGIEVSGEDQPFGQNAYSRTSQQTYRDVAGVTQETWIIGNNKVNDFRFQYARRGLSYFFNTATPGGSDPAVNIPGFANFAGEIMIFFGAFKNGWVIDRFHLFQIATVLALWGVVISTVYMLRAYRKTFMGTINEQWKQLVDLRAGLRVPVTLIVGALLCYGFFPRSFVQMLAPKFRTYLTANR